MAELLDERMNRTSSLLHEKQKLDKDSSLVKTYLIEANLPETYDPKHTTEFISDKLPQVVGKRINDVKLTLAKHDTLVSIETKVSNQSVVAYLDFTNPRFWLLHSMSDSSAIDWLTARWTNDIQELDRTWFPADFLETCIKLGSLRGLGLDYDRRVIADVDFEQPDAPAEVLKMQLWGRKAPQVLKTMRSQSAFPHQTTLSKVKIRYEDPENRGYCVDDIKFDGKITARGTSFEDHMALTLFIYEKYRQEIRRLETIYALRSRPEDGRLLMEGSPINFLFDPPIADLDKFCEVVFSSSQPFRLWGVPVRFADSFVRVQAVDLHSGHCVGFELSKDFIRMYLPVGSCGNSVLRFYTNLQHYYDSLVRVTNGDGGPVFEFQSANAESLDRSVQGCCRPSEEYP